jgi:polyphosphate kinase
MTPQSGLAKSAYLLSEFRRDTHSLPLRLRALNMFTYSLDVLYMEEAPALMRGGAASNPTMQELRALSATVMGMLDEAADLVHAEVVPALLERGLHLHTVDECTPAERQWLERYFAHRVRPLLTPLAVDAGHPFPQISAHSLNLLAVLQEPARFDIDMPNFARLKVPRWVPRMVQLCDGAGEQECLDRPGAHSSNGFGSRVSAYADRSDQQSFVLSEDMVRAHVETLFPGMTVEGVYQFRILRGEHTGSDWPVGRHSALARQKGWPVVRLDIERTAPDWVVQWLQRNLAVPEAVILRRPAPLGLGTLAGDWAERTSVAGEPSMVAHRHGILGER